MKEFADQIKGHSNVLQSSKLLLEQEQMEKL